MRWKDSVGHLSAICLAFERGPRKNKARGSWHASRVWHRGGSSLTVKLRSQPRQAQLGGLKYSSENTITSTTLAEAQLSTSMATRRQKVHIARHT